jgi:hypothetical protein
VDAAARDRAAQRRRSADSWPLRPYRLGDEPARDPLDRSTIDERLAAVWPLTKAAWSISGKEIPTYARAASPGLMLRQRSS